jgi:hypothetical protein
LRGKEKTVTLVRQTLMALNHDLAQIPISEDRVEPMLIEVRQFVAAIEGARSKLDFDTEPADFRVTLTAVAKGSPRG